MAQKVADGTKKKSPESEAQIMALILTVMVWLVVAAFIILFPGKILQNQEPQVYQDISLRLSYSATALYSPVEKHDCQLSRNNFEQHGPLTT